MTVTVETLRAQARQRCDMDNRNFISPTEWIQLIDVGYKELYDILVARFEDWYTINEIFTVPQGSTSYPLPANFYKLRGLDRSLSGGTGPEDFYPIQPFNFENRNNRGMLLRRRGFGPNAQYRIMQNNFIFTPTDQAGGTYQIWYVPRAVTLTDPAQTVDGVNGWEEYIVLTAAIKALTKEESDVSVLAAEKANLYKRIELMASNRDGGQTERVTDVQSQNYGGSWYGFNY